MKQIFKLVILPILIILSAFNVNASASNQAKSYATDWIINLGTKAHINDIKNIVEAAFKYGAKHNIDPLLVLSLIGVESTFNKSAKNKSKASGLMQVIPKYHKDKIKSRNIFAVNVNIEVGTKVLRDCLDRNSQVLNKALKCYSGGASNRYNKKVRNNHIKMRNWIIENQFRLQLPLYYAKTNEDNLSF